MKHKSVGVRDIARMANVDPSTVSRALNNSPRVKPETRARIAEIAKQYHYVPDSIGKSLSQGKTSAVGIMVPEISNPFYAHIVDSLERELTLHGLSLIISGTQFDEVAERRSIQVMISKRVDALIICTPSSAIIPQAEALSKRIPVILCDSIHTESFLDTVCVDEKMGIHAAVEYLLEKKHTKIGCISDYATHRRMAVFKAVLEEFGLPVKNENMYYGESNAVQSGYDAVMHMYQQGVLPSALLTTRDTIAIGAMRAALELNIPIPDQLSIIGFDDIRIANFQYKKITTIRQPADAIGRNVAKLLLQKLKEESPEHTFSKILLIPQLVIRESA